MVAVRRVRKRISGDTVGCPVELEEVDLLEVLSHAYWDRVVIFFSSRCNARACFLVFCNVFKFDDDRGEVMLTHGVHACTAWPHL